MKCLNPSCDWTGIWAYCAKCRSLTGPDPQVAQCTGTHEDGSICEAQVKATQRYCSYCGTKVNPHLFTRLPSTLHPNDSTNPVDSPKENKDETQQVSSDQIESTSNKKEKVINPPSLPQVLENLEAVDETSKSQESIKKQKKINDENTETFKKDDLNGKADEEKAVRCKSSQASSPYTDKDTKKHAKEDKKQENDHNINTLPEEITEQRKRKKKNKKKRKKDREKREKDNTPKQENKTENIAETIQDLEAEEKSDCSACKAITDLDLSSCVTSSNDIKQRENCDMSAFSEKTSSVILSNVAKQEEKCDMNNLSGTSSCVTSSEGICNTTKMPENDNTMLTKSSARIRTVIETNVDTLEKTTLCETNESKSHDLTNIKEVNDEPKVTTVKQSTSSEKMITVKFHAFVSNEFNFNEDEDKLFIQTDMPGDDWTSEERICVPKRTFDSSMPEMVFEMDIPASRITGDKKVQYRYFIEKQKERKRYFESYVASKNTGKGPNRTLHIIRQWKKSDTWNQFDGVIEKENKLKDMTPNVLNWKKKEIKKKVCAAMKLFFEDIVHRSDLLFCEKYDQVEILLHCLKKIYVYDGDIWKTEQDFMETRKTNTGALNDRYTTRICESLLLRPDPENKSCPEIQFVLSHFVDRKSLTDLFLGYIKEIASSSKNPAWLYLMPWLHFLEDECLPYQEPQFNISHDSNIPFWWGIPYIYKEVEMFKQNHGDWFISPTDVLNKICPLFAMDYLLQRTFLAAVELKDLDLLLRSKTFSIDVVLANLVYHFRTTGYRSPNFLQYYVLPEEQESIKCACGVVGQLQETFEGHGIGAECLLMATYFAFDMLKEAVETNRHLKVYACVQICSHCLALYDQSVKEGKGNITKTFDENQYIESFVKEITRWIDRHRSNVHFYMSKNLDELNNVFALVHLQSERVRDLWNEKMSMVLDNYIEKKIFQTSQELTQEFISYYCEKSDSCVPPMQECLTKSAFKAIEKGHRVNFGGLMETQKRKLGNLLSDFFIREWQNKVSDASIKKHVLHHALSWTPMETFLKKCNGRIFLLSENCQQNIAITQTVITDIVEELISGKISVETLNVLRNFESKLTELAVIIDEKRWGSEIISKAISIREREVDAFKEHVHYVTSLIQLCGKLEIEDKAVLTQVLRKQECFEEIKIEEMCTPIEIGDVNDLQECHPQITICDDIPFDKCDLALLHTYNKSNIFLTMWQRESSDKIKECKTVSEVNELIWKPVKRILRTFISKIERGNITFNEMDSYFGEEKDSTYMRSEMEHLQICTTHINHRLKQLSQFRQLEMCVKGAKTILEFKNSFCLSGSFEQVQKISEHENMDMNMVDFNEELMEAFRLLIGLTEKQARCISVFTRCKQLVHWLKETMKSGLKELKVFLDLAFMSAGDDPLKVLRVSWFHSAVTGYAPLIFDLRQDADFNQFLKVCDIVWKELEANDKLPDKMWDTQQQLEWFKNVQAAHGSVEVTSLNQAHAINSTGLFVVGSIGEKQDKQSTALGLDKVLCLTAVIGSERKEYSIKELQDLQSRLMLVAGKSELESNSVKRFTEVFDSVLRLSNVYIKLCKAGCVLFEDWTAKFLCKKEITICTILEFGADKDNPLQYRRGKDADLQDIIKNLAHFLECCYDNWLTHISEKRNKNKFLNYFTNDQLVILQRELLKFGKQDGPSKAIYPLLSAVRKSCSEYHLKEAMSSAKARISRCELQDQQNSEVESGNVYTDKDKLTNDVERIFVQKLVKLGFNERHAIVALQNVSPENIDEEIRMETLILKIKMEKHMSYPLHP